MTTSVKLGQVLSWVLEQPVRKADREAIMAAYDRACDNLREAEAKYSSKVCDAALHEASGCFESISPPPTHATLKALGLLLNDVDRWDRAVRTLAAAVEEADRRLEEAVELYGPE